MSIVRKWLDGGEIGWVIEDDIPNSPGISPKPDWWIPYEPVESVLIRVKDGTWKLELFTGHYSTQFFPLIGGKCGITHIHPLPVSSAKRSFDEACDQIYMTLLPDD